MPAFSSLMLTGCTGAGISCDEAARVVACAMRVRLVADSDQARGHCRGMLGQGADRARSPGQDVGRTATGPAAMCRDAGSAVDRGTATVLVAEARGPGHVQGGAAYTGVPRSRRDRPAVIAGHVHGGAAYTGAAYMAVGRSRRDRPAVLAARVHGGGAVTPARVHGGGAVIAGRYPAGSGCVGPAARATMVPYAAAAVPRIGCRDAQTRY